MKKITIYIVMALLCLNFSVQGQENKAVDVTLKGIQIGQKVPDITITNLHNYKDASGKPATTAKLSDFKGKLLILDFWATWCSPCIAMIPKMDSLQKAFGDQIQFLSVTYQTEKEVMSFLEKLEKQRGKHYDLPIVTGDKSLHQLFPHVYLPHYVWIDGSGVVKAITGFEEVNEENINKAIASPVQLVQKKDMKIAYDNKRPFLINGNGGDGSNLIYHTLFTGFIEGLPGSGSFSTDSIKGRKISIKNATIRRLVEVAFSDADNVFNQSNMLFEVKDPTKLTSKKSGEAYRQWLREGNGYCYELIVPYKMGNLAAKFMQEDLRRLFSQYTFDIVSRDAPCLVLQRTSTLDKLKSKGDAPKVEIGGLGYHIQNVSLSNLLYRLNFLKRTKFYLLDETGYKGKVDMEVNADLNNLNVLNKELEKYDLKLVTASRQRNILLVRDKSIND